jgi:hypothetical protein
MAPENCIRIRAKIYDFTGTEASQRGPGSDAHEYYTVYLVPMEMKTPRHARLTAIRKMVSHALNNLESTTTRTA